MATIDKCDGCGQPLPDHMHLCDRAPDQMWCCACFINTECGNGMHGDDCESVCDRVAAPSEELVKLATMRDPRTPRRLQ